MMIQKLGLWCLNKLRKELDGMIGLGMSAGNRSREEFIDEIQKCILKIPESADNVSLQRAFSLVYGYTPSGNTQSSWFISKLREAVSQDDCGEHSIGDVFSKHGEVLVLTGHITQSSSKMGLFYSHKTKQECAFELKSMLPFRVEKQVIPTRNSAMNTRKPSVQIHSLKGTKNALCSRGCGKRNTKACVVLVKCFGIRKDTHYVTMLNRRINPFKVRLVRMERSKPNQIPIRTSCAPSV